ADRGDVRRYAHDAFPHGYDTPAGRLPALTAEGPTVPPVSPTNIPCVCTARAITVCHALRPSVARSRLGSSWMCAPSGIVPGPLPFPSLAVAGGTGPPARVFGMPTTSACLMTPAASSSGRSFPAALANPAAVAARP